MDCGGEGADHKGASDVSKSFETKLRSGSLSPWRQLWNERMGYRGFSVGEEANLVNVDSSMAQTMASPATRSASTAISACGEDQHPAEALSGFLKDMARTVESLSNRHKILAQSYADARCSMALGMAPLSVGMQPAGVEAPTTQSSRRGMHSVQLMTHNYDSVVSGDQATLKKHCGVASLDETLGWIAQNRTNGVKTQGRTSGILGEETARITEEQLKNTSSQTNFETYPSNPKILDDVRCLLEDMKKTIHAWCSRHKLLLEGSGISAREDAEIADSVSLGVPSSSYAVTSSEMAPRAEPLSSCFWLTSANRGSGRTAFPRESDVGMHHPNHGDPEGTGHHPNHGDAEALRSPHSRADHEPPANGVVATEHFMQREDREACPTQGHLSGCEKEEVKSKGGGVDVFFQLNKEGNVVQIVPQLEHGEMDVEYTPKNSGEEEQGDGSLVPDSSHGGAKPLHSSDWIPQDSAAEIGTERTGEDNSVQPVTSPSGKRILKVVESPNWLPNGWITEIKFRASGHRAGAKDKYYFDPTSKRRFRSKSEVFCFLKTGKLGRYKPRPKIKPEKPVGKDKPPSARKAASGVQAGQASLAKSTVKSTSPNAAPDVPGISCPSAVSVSASGHFSNVFMPFRAGQSSEWHYEKLATLPVPMLDHSLPSDNNIAKTNGHRRPPNGHWVFSSYGSWRPYLDKTVVSKADERENSKDKILTNLEFSGGGQMHESEIVQKHSAAGTRKSKKKSH